MNQNIYLVKLCKRVVCLIPQSELHSASHPKRAVSSVCEALDHVEEARPYESIPGPKPIPFLGNTWRFIPYIGDFQIEHIDRVATKLFNKYGKIVKMEGLLGRPDMLFLFDPRDVEMVYRREDLLPLRPSMPSLNYYKHVLRKDFFGDMAGVIAVHGENWQKFRSKVNQIMLQPRSAKMYTEAISCTAEQFVRRLATIQNEESEMPNDFLNEIHKWSLESLARIALDIRLGCLDPSPPVDTQNLIDAINTFFINVPILELKIPFWKIFNTKTFTQYIEALDCIREICLKYINLSMENLKHLEDDSKLSVMQKVLKKEQNAKLASILALDMFLVGVDTISNAVASILYQLAIHPDKQKLLHEEIEKVLPKVGSKISNSHLEQLNYLRACVKETMRMYPVVIGNGRQTTSNCTIAGYHVPKGVQVIFQHYVMSNQEEFFMKSNEFHPERWLKNNPLFKDTHPFVSLPFGFGKRMCLGKRFAELEIQILLVKIFSKYKVEYHHEPLSYHIHPMYTPNGPLKLKFLTK
nr:Cytochrome P450 [Sitophilus oryzae]